MTRMQFWSRIHPINILLAVLIFFVGFPGIVMGKIYIDINAPSIERIQIAVPDFHNQTTGGTTSDMTESLPRVLSNDLALSGYFLSIDKSAFLNDNTRAFSPQEIRFKDWTTIGAELLLKGRFSTVGRNLEVEARMFDVFSGRQILGKRYLGKVKDSRAVMHRLANDIILMLTGHKGMFLSKLAYVDKKTGNKEVYISDLDGHNRRQITRDESIALSPRWSPAGDKIIFNSYKEGEGPMLYLKDLSTGIVRRLSSRKGLNIGASWAPDGKSIALTLSGGDNPDIYLIDLKGKIKKRLTNHWGIDVSPVFSPEGKRIAFVSNRSGSPQIYTKDLTSGAEQRLTFEGKYNTSPSWSRRNRVAFAGSRDGRFQIFTIDPEGGRLQQMTEDQGNNEDPCWSPDGRYLVFSSNREGRYHLHIMNALGQNQQNLGFKEGAQTSPSWAPY